MRFVLLDRSVYLLQEGLDVRLERICRIVGDDGVAFRVYVLSDWRIQQREGGSVLGGLDGCRLSSLQRSYRVKAVC